MWPGMPHSLASSCKQPTAQSFYQHDTYTHTHTQWQGWIKENGHTSFVLFWGVFWFDDPCSCENLCSISSLSCCFSQHWGLGGWIFGYTDFLIVWDLMWFSFALLFPSRTEPAGHRSNQCQSANGPFSFFPFSYFLPSQIPLSGFTPRSHLCWCLLILSHFVRSPAVVTLTFSMHISPIFSPLGGSDCNLVFHFTSIQLFYSSVFSPQGK